MTSLTEQLMSNVPEDTKTSAASDPANAMAVTEAALQDPEPTIPLPPPGMVELPGGYIDPTSGAVLSQAQVRELTGRDEEESFSLRNSKNTMDIVNFFLDRAVVQLGGQPFTPLMRDGMLAGDRDMLMLAIRIATYGNTYRLSHYPCPHCAELQEITIDLEPDVPIKKMKDPMKRVIDVPLRNGKTASVRLVTGADQYAAWAFDYVPEMNTEILSRCVQRIGGTAVMEMRKDAREVVKDLGLADRQAILKALTDAQPGPAYEEVEVPCSNCGESITPVIEVANLLRSPE